MSQLLQLDIAELGTTCVELYDVASQPIAAIGEHRQLVSFVRTPEVATNYELKF